jgi:mono/diheme cytochrome c family protein
MLRETHGWALAAATLTLLGACAGDDAAAPQDQRGGDLAQQAGGEAGTIPCDIEKIVKQRCQTCHGPTPLSAPFSLATLADFQGPSMFDPEKPMYTAAFERINSTNRREKMPPPAIDALTPEELTTFGNWLQGGAKAGPACGAGAVDAGGATADAGAPAVDASAPPADASVPAPDAAAPVSTNKGGSGGASATRIDYDDPDLKCYELRGFATPANKSQKYSVPTTPDLYVAFNMKAPWTGTQYIKSFRSLIDNAPVLHHWLLFRQLNGGREGVTPNALGAHPDGEMLYGWAPGGDDMWFDADVGMEVPAGSVFQLETHYNNRTGAPSPDSSGVEVCVTPKKPAHVAGLSWVGTDAINGTTARGTCTHSSRAPIKLIASQPHMHKKGSNMKVELRRASGATEIIHDKPFDFDYQRAYIHNLEIQPGDKMTTTCSYSSPARFGKGTSDEMCYFFSIHWPAGALSRSNFNSIIHGPNTCID